MVIDKHFWRIPQIFFHPDNTSSVYVPLTMLSFFYENLFFGQRPFISHAMNFLLHLSVCGLVYVFAQQLRLSVTAALAAVFIFAIHPMHVEPVAWVSARRDLLYSFFYLASMVAYCRYVDKRSSRDYIFSLAAAGLSVLAKPMALSLPLALFLVDFLKGRQFQWGLLLEKIPFILAVEPIAGITYLMNARMAPDAGTASPLLWIWSASFYVQKFFLPVDLSLLYLPPLPASIWDPTYSWSIVIFFSVVLFVWHFRRARIMVFAVGWYVISAFFLWRFDAFDLQMVADRFMYLPSLGFCFASGILFERWARRTSGRSIVPATIIFMVFMIVLTNLHARKWDNPYRLWTSVIEHTSRKGSAYKMRSYALRMRAETVLRDEPFLPSRADVLRLLEGSLYSSEHARRLLNDGSYEGKLRAVRFLLASRDLRKALLLDPDNPKLYYSFGGAFVYLNNYRRAEFFLRKALVGRPNNGEFLQYMGFVQERMGQDGAALSFYSQAISTGQAAPVVFRRRAVLFYRYGRVKEALSDALAWLGFKPDDAEVNALALETALEVGDIHTAEILANNYQDFFPKEPFGHIGRARVLSKKQDCQGARAELDKARALGHVSSPEETRSFQERCP